MYVHIIERQQKIPVSIESAWSFFSNPHNLKLITPPDLGLELTCKPGNSIYPGMIITYNVNVLPFLTTGWITEITHVEKYRYFVDEQRTGPYSFWHHKHFFRETADGVVVSDLVHYIMPFGPLGDLVNSLYVKKNLKSIFDFRENVLKSMFAD